MSWRFEFRPDAEASEIRLVGPAGAAPFERWALDAPAALLPGVDLAQRLVAAESAVEAEGALLVASSAIAGLSSAEAAKLGLPRAADAVARIAASGLMTKPDYRAELDWVSPTGQAISGVQRLGPWLKIGAAWFRLPDVHYAIAGAVDRLNGVGGDMAERLKALADLREVLPGGVEQGLAQTSGLIGHIHIAIADAFSLDLQGEPGRERLAPVLHRAAGEPDAPLLPPEQQRAFVQRFDAASAVPGVYSLGGQWWVVPQPPLRRALAVVRRLNGASTSARRAFMANPRAYLREELGDDEAETMSETVFRETPAYAARVIGLGLWTPRVVPWIQLSPSDWFGAGGEARPRPGLTIGDRPLPLDARQADTLAAEIESAMVKSATHVTVEAPDGPLDVPATRATLDALAQIRKPPPAPPPRPKPELQGLIIKPNEADLDLEEDVRPARSAPPLGAPLSLLSQLKSHQQEGLRWLQQSWIKGLPGVLLADDMGLGKTLQGLAFLIWLKAGMRAGELKAGPLLVVAPTGLLKNWRAEHDKHLAGQGLGRCVEAFGKGLSALKLGHPDGAPGLNAQALGRADWVLTTYETLRDYDRDFGQIAFVAALFDEAQKIKTPGVRITDAAKAMNCEFRVALTGTPVENRLADLWCVVDGVHPGWLGDLKTFSARYEQALDEEKLRGLKASLERPFGGRPPVMLRRLKEDRLPDLPAATQRPLPKPMPPQQREAYAAALRGARAAQAPGEVLAALQKLRSLSLHPRPADDCGDEDFIAASARLQGGFAALDEIAARREKALLFIDDLDMQARLAGLLQRRYRLPRPPGLINGTLDGVRRQALVDAFQNSPEGFEAMILSPRAGGVGLTLTRANHVIHLSRWWNPAVEDQCNGRVHRIGAVKPITIHLPMAVLGEAQPRAFDENLDELLSRKRKLMRETLTPPEATADRDREGLFRSTLA